MNKKLLILNTFIILGSIILFILDYQEPIDSFVYNHLIFTDTLTTIFKIITVLANASMILIVLICIFYYSHHQKRIREGMEFTLFTVLSLIFMSLLKYIFKRKRPSIKRLIEITGFSFPSGHAYTSIIVYGYIVYLINRDVRQQKRKIAYITVLSIIIFLIGLSRVYLGVHYLTDILFGYSLGLFNLQLFLHYRKSRECKRIKKNHKYIPKK